MFILYANSRPILVINVQGNKVHLSIPGMVMHGTAGMPLPEAFRQAQNRRRVYRLLQQPGRN